MSTARNTLLFGAALAVTTAAVAFDHATSPVPRATPSATQTVAGGAAPCAAGAPAPAAAPCAAGAPKAAPPPPMPEEQQQDMAAPPPPPAPMPEGATEAPDLLEDQ